MGEVVIGVLGGPVIDGQADGCLLAVSTLAMASAVAWADWVISCCGVISEAMSQVLDGLIMVRLEKTVGRIQKCLYLGNHWSNLTSDLNRV